MFWKTILFCAICASVDALMKKVYSNSTVPYQIYSVTAGTGYVSMFVITSEGVIVVDPDNEKQAQGIMVSIRNVTQQPVKYCIYSHSHWDHCGGGQVFRDAGAVILAHAEAMEYFKIPGHLGKGVLFPDQSWDGKKHDLVLGGLKIELHYVGISHGWGMTVVLIPDAKLLFVSDLMTPRRLMFSYMPDFNYQGTERSLRYIANLDFDKAVWSHTPYADQLQLGTKQEVQEIREYLIDLREAVQGHIDQGAPLAQIQQLVKLPKYANWANYSDWLEINVNKVMMEITLGPEGVRPEWPWRSEEKTITQVKVECHFQSTGAASAVSVLLNVAFFAITVAFTCVW